MKIQRLLTAASLLFSLSVASLANPPTAQELYEKAVNAYAEDNCLKALELIDNCLKLSPESKQAQKLKLVIESALHPSDAPDALGTVAPSRDSLWTFYQGANTLETAPEFIHVIHTAEGTINDPAYATMSLTIPANATEYEVIFRMKLHELGSLGTGVFLRSSEKLILSFFGDSTSRVFGTPAEVISRKRADTAWHEYHIRWRGGFAELSCDGQSLGRGAAQGIPNLLQFGSIAGSSGRQTEAFFEWVGMNYNVPAG